MAASLVTIGVDVGQRVDPTAIVVVEAVRRVHGEPITFVVRDLSRLSLGTPYPEVAGRLVQVVARLATQPQPRRWRVPDGPIVPHLRVDATGVGLPVVELIRQALRREDADFSLTPVTFTHGDRYNRRWSGGAASVGKAYLVSRLQALLQTERIRMPDTTEARVLARELLDYEIKVSDDADDRYGAFRVGSHDDLVTALGLAVLEDPWMLDGDGTVPLTVNGVGPDLW